MSLHIENLVSDVTTEDETPGKAQRPAPAFWEQLVMLRRLQARALLDDARASAFGSED